MGSDVVEEGNGLGFYDFCEFVWYVNCCNVEMDNGWDVFNVLLGWENLVIYGLVFVYNIYWFVFIIVISCLFYEECIGYLLLGF